MSSPGGHYIILGGEAKRKAHSLIDNMGEFNSDSNYSTSSDSSLRITSAKSAVELSSKRRAWKTKMCPSYLNSSQKIKRRRSKINKENIAFKRLQMVPKFSDKNVQASGDNYFCEEIGSDFVNTYVCSLYITTYNGSEENVVLNVEPFIQVLKHQAIGKIKIERTPSGILVAFTKEIDADQVMKLRLQNVFSEPVQLAKLKTGEYKYCNMVVIKDLPWCISYADILKALQLQGIQVGSVTRTASTVLIEVFNSLYVHKLIEEGLNFFNHVSFPAELQKISTQPAPDIVQCYKCQGFWHTSMRCRQIPRCVRCGENHDVAYCPRPRNSPICCHCGGPHHAAYKACPIRLKHIHSTYVGFQLAKNKPPKSFHENLPY